MRAVDRAVVHLQQANLAQFDEEFRVQPGPDPSFGPVPQAARGGHARAANHTGGHIPPGHTFAQHVDNARQGNPLRHPKPAWVSVPSRGLLWQQWGYALPQVIRDKIVGHPADTAHECHRLSADTPISF